MIQKVAENLKSEKSSLKDQMIPSLLETSRNGGLFIDLFQKPQHGGLRDIYVLGFHERVVQCVLETVSRTICDLFPEETMTHLGAKQSIPISDRQMQNKTLRSPLTVCSSDDATKWNQGHFVTKFCQILCYFTPTYMHAFLIRALSLWMKRRIRIYDSLLKLMSLTTQTVFSDKMLQKMNLGFNGTALVKWMKPGCNCIVTKSGMMQGILHYTSCDIFKMNGPPSSQTCQQMG